MSKRVNMPEAKESEPAVMSTTTYSSGPSTRWFRHSSTAPDLGVVAGDPQVGLGEGAGDHQPDGAAVEFRPAGRRRRRPGCPRSTRSSREPAPGGVVLIIVSAEVIRGLEPRR